MVFRPLIVSGEYRSSASRWGLSHSFLTAAPPHNTVTTANKRDTSNLDTTNEVPHTINFDMRLKHHRNDDGNIKLHR
jgi:hypothetical protein